MVQIAAVRARAGVCSIKGNVLHQGQGQRQGLSARARPGNAVCSDGALLCGKWSSINTKNMISIIHFAGATKITKTKVFGINSIRLVLLCFTNSIAILLEWFFAKDFGFHSVKKWQVWVIWTNYVFYILKILCSNWTKFLVLDSQIKLSRKRHKVKQHLFQCSFQSTFLKCITFSEEVFIQFWMLKWFEGKNWLLLLVVVIAPAKIRIEIKSLTFFDAAVHQLALPFFAQSIK